MSKIVDAVNGDLDLSPTIRPVLDLTDVESGKKSLERDIRRRRYVCYKWTSVLACKGLQINRFVYIE